MHQVHSLEKYQQIKQLQDTHSDKPKERAQLKKPKQCQNILNIIIGVARWTLY